jgi:predicted nucleotidyltransferase component of viral defense system
MVDRRELLDNAAKLSLRPQIVEKDVVLGWVLAGIYNHEPLIESWIFKGGTCLKKCYFETYRFSEDLDFTLTDSSHIDETFLQHAFGEISEWIYEQTGIEMPADQHRFEIYDNPRGRPACQGRLSYRGPVSPTAGGLPKVRLDLTADEVVVLPASRVSIFHPYSDAPDKGIQVRSYAYEEAFAEKVRALGERARPRDLYDVINLFRNTETRPSSPVLREVLRQKCDFKGIPVPRLADLEPHRTTLEGSWQPMLGHQLPALPPVETFWNELPAFFDWLEGGEAPVVRAAYAASPGETVIRERVLRLPVPGRAQSYLEVIRFAAFNRLCVDLDHVDLSGRRSTRRIEPYSLRRTSEGNIVLHAFNTAKDAHRSYRLERVRGARVTNETFVPRYEVELTPHGPLRIQPTAGGSVSLGSGSLARRSRSRRPSRKTGGP